MHAYNLFGNNSIGQVNELHNSPKHLIYPTKLCGEGIWLKIPVTECIILLEYGMIDQINHN